MGGATLASGVLGAMCFWRRDFWLHVVIGGGVISMGAGTTHVVDLMAHGNLAPNNVGAILYVDILVPMARSALNVWLAHTEEWPTAAQPVLAKNE